MINVSLLAVPSQVINVQLAGQNCTINVYQKTTGLYCDLYVDNVLIIGGVICQNTNLIVRDAYLGFIGDLAFFDMQGGNTDPVYTGLGTQYLLFYIEASEIAAP